MKIIVASAWTGFVLGFLVMSARADDRGTLEMALIGGLLVALFAASIGVAWAWAVGG